MAEGGQGNLDDGGIQISVISASFFLRVSSTLVMYASVSFWSSSWAFLASSSVIWEAFWAFLISSSTSRRIDRKSTRLNSSHGYISYAVFCLKKKKTQRQSPVPTQISHR